MERVEVFGSNTLDFQTTVNQSPATCLIVVVVVQSLSCVRLLWPHRLQHSRLPCPSLSPGVCTNSYPLSRWCHPNVLSSFTSFSSCLQSFPSGLISLSLLTWKVVRINHVFQGLLWGWDLVWDAPGKAMLCIGSGWSNDWHTWVCCLSCLKEPCWAFKTHHKCHLFWEVLLDSFCLGERDLCQLSIFQLPWWLRR